MKHRKAACSWVKQNFQRGYSDELWTFGDTTVHEMMTDQDGKLILLYILRSCTEMCACWVPSDLFILFSFSCFKIMNHYESLFIILFWIMLVGLSVDDTKFN